MQKKQLIKNLVSCLSILLIYKIRCK